MLACLLTMAIRVVEFSNGGTKLERFLPKDSDNFRHRKLTLNVKFWHFWALFDTHPLIQFSKFNNFLWVCWFIGKNLSNLYPPFENSTTHIAILLTCLLGLSSRLAFSCRLHDLSASSMNFYISVQQRSQALLQLSSRKYHVATLWNSAHHALFLCHYVRRVVGRSGKS